MATRRPLPLLLFLVCASSCCCNPVSFTGYSSDESIPLNATELVQTAMRNAKALAGVAHHKAPDDQMFGPNFMFTPFNHHLGGNRSILVCIVVERGPFRFHEIKERWNAIFEHLAAQVLDDLPYLRIECSKEGVVVTSQIILP